MTITNRKEALQALELDPAAHSISDEVIRKNYLRLALEWHPDKNRQKDAENQFKIIQAAYEFLRDEIMSLPPAVELLNDLLSKKQSEFQKSLSPLAQTSDAQIDQVRALGSDTVSYLETIADAQNAESKKLEDFSKQLQHIQDQQNLILMFLRAFHSSPSRLPHSGMPEKLTPASVAKQIGQIFSSTPKATRSATRSVTTPLSAAHSALAASPTPLTSPPKTSISPLNSARSISSPSSFKKDNLLIGEEEDHSEIRKELFPVTTPAGASSSYDDKRNEKKESLEDRTNTKAAGPDPTPGPATPPPPLKPPASPPFWKKFFK